MAAARSTIAGVGRDKAAAVVTDGGTLAVVGTGDATARLSPGQLVTVDGAAGPIS
jgi:rifampicin phosphotransferase